MKLGYMSWKKFALGLVVGLIIVFIINNFFISDYLALSIISSFLAIGFATWAWYLEDKKKKKQ